MCWTKSLFMFAVCLHPTDLWLSFIPFLCLQYFKSLSLCFHHDDVNKVDRMDYPDSHGSVPALRLVCCSALLTGGNHSLSLITLHLATSMSAHSHHRHTHTHQRECRRWDSGWIHWHIWLMCAALRCKHDEEFSSKVFWEAIFSASGWLHVFGVW